MSRFVVLAFGALAFSVCAQAFQTDGWDVGEEMAARDWREATLMWARSLREDAPPVHYLLKFITPPPREMWCISPEYPEYCDAWGHAMEQWLHHYLDIPYSEPLPQELPQFPKECESSCKNW